MRLVARCFWEPSGRHPCALDARPTREDEMSQRVALRASAAVTRPLLRTPAPTSEAKAPKLSIANDTHRSVVRCDCDPPNRYPPRDGTQRVRRAANSIEFAAAFGETHPGMRTRSGLIS